MPNLIKKSRTVSYRSSFFSLDVEDNEAIVDGKFQLECKTGGIFEEAISWPTCIVENCTQLLTQSGYVGNETELPVAVGDKVGYRQEIHFMKFLVNANFFLYQVFYKKKESNDPFLQLCEMGCIHLCYAR